jgi:tetratricopeptide (TPR) repeat protein
MRFLFGAAGIAAYAFLASAFHGQSFGQPAASLARSAADHLAQGLAELNDGALRPADRLSRYRIEMTVAEELLVRSLDARPTSARTLAQLAATRFELDPPLDEASAGRHRATIRAAGLLAPGVPQVQIQLGELLIKMGRLGDATEYLRRAVDLDPRMSARAVAVLRESLLTVDEQTAALPRTPEVLAALDRSYREAGRDLDYLAIVESSLAAGGAAHRPLVVSYANACFAAGLPHRAVERLGALGPLVDREADAMRLVQLSRAHGVLGDRDRAVETAREAERVSPAAWTSEQLGSAHAAAGDGTNAIAAFRRALASAARERGDARTRARLYRRIGQAEELRGQGARAFEAYRRAVEVDPAEPIAGRRLAQMRSAAGR